MENRSEIRRRLLRARKAAKTHMDAICGTSPLTYPLLKQELRQFILAKFLLDEEEIPEEALKEAVKKIGYEVTSVSSAPYQKKGLFHR